MASHFQCLGLPLTPEGSTDADVVALVRAMAATAVALPAPEGFAAFRWEDASGAAAHGVVALAEDGARVRCLTPFFVGGTRVRARVARALPDADCPFCDYLQVEIPGPDGRSTPLLVEVKDPGYSRDADLRGAEVTLQVALLAQRVEAVLEAASPAAPPGGLPAERIEATGLATRPPTARARLTARTGPGRRLVNPVGGGAFLHATVDLPGGASFDLLAAAEDLPGGFVEGGRVIASCSVIGRIVDGPAREAGGVGV